MELVKQHEEMCEKIRQIVAERINCKCSYTLRGCDNIVSIAFDVELNDYEFYYVHEVHIRELEMCLERHNSSVLPIADAIVQSVKTALVNSIFREDEKYYDPQRAI